MSMDLSILARTLAERLREQLRFVRSHVSTQVDLEENFIQRIEAAIREAIEKTLQQERLRLAEEAEKSSYLRLVLADVPKHVALWLRGQA